VGTTRRGFVRLCLNAVAAAAALPALLRAADTRPGQAIRTGLVNASGEPLYADRLGVGQTYVFHYPFVTTPCFLVDTGRALPGGEILRTRDGQTYTWRGGAGHRQSIVAYSAICAHRMSYPTGPVSFINYRHGNARFVDASRQAVERAQVIYCCSEKSVYDATAGGRVLGGPAPQPLAAIALEARKGDGALFATGYYGGDMFEKFLTDFSFRLRLDHPGIDIRQSAGATAVVLPLSEYTGNAIQC